MSFRRMPRREILLGPRFLAKLENDKLVSAVEVQMVPVAMTIAPLGVIIFPVRARVLSSLMRWLYKHFYNRFAFTYDAVSAIVSRREWREWTRAAIPFIAGARVLEVAFGTGNLLLDLSAAGYAPVGIDLSPFMIEITQKKFRARELSLRLIRARAQQLPFPGEHFDSIVMTFPPGFVTDPRAMNEMRRVLAEHGRLIWVDAPLLYPRSAWTRLLNWAYSINGGSAYLPPDAAAVQPSRVAAPPGVASLLPRTGWHWRVERIERAAGLVHVMIGTKSNS